MPFVLDASCAAAWVLPDELAPSAEAAAERLGSDTGLVPILFWFEIRHLLLRAERRGRIIRQQTAQLLADLEATSITLDSLPTGSDVLDLARTHGLTVYDASYLELARRRDVPLATLDRALIAAAGATGVPLLAA